MSTEYSIRVTYFVFGVHSTGRNNKPAAEIRYLIIRYNIRTEEFDEITKILSSKY
jgi:hypothetical protein